MTIVYTKNIILKAILLSTNHFRHFNIRSFVESAFQFSFCKAIFAVQADGGFQPGVGIENDFTDSFLRGKTEAML